MSCVRTIQTVSHSWVKMCSEECRSTPPTHDCRRHQPESSPRSEAPFRSQQRKNCCCIRPDLRNLLQSVDSRPQPTLSAPVWLSVFDTGRATSRPGPATPLQLPSSHGALLIFDCSWWADTSATDFCQPSTVGRIIEPPVVPLGFCASLKRPFQFHRFDVCLRRTHQNSIRHPLSARICGDLNFFCISPCWSCL